MARNLAKAQEKETQVARKVLLAGRREELKSLLSHEQEVYKLELASKGLAIAADD